MRTWSGCPSCCRCGQRELAFSGPLCGLCLCDFMPACLCTGLWELYNGRPLVRLFMKPWTLTLLNPVVMITKLSVTCCHLSFIPGCPAGWLEEIALQLAGGVSKAFGDATLSFNAKCSSRLLESCLHFLICFFLR